MTKISIDVDLTNDRETILKEIQEKAESEMRKRKNKERIDSQLTTLHEKVNKTTGTRFSNINELIRALAVHATPTLRDRILGVTSTGRRKTVTMSKDLFQTIKDRLAKGDSSKARIAREAAVSPSQVRKVEQGGYDSKFGHSAVVSKAKATSADKTSKNTEGDMDELVKETMDEESEEKEATDSSFPTLPFSADESTSEDPQSSAKPEFSKEKLSSSVTRPPIRRLEED